MCELFDQYERRGRIEQLILDNMEEHRPEEIIIDKLVHWFSLTREQAKMYYDKYARVEV